MRTVIPVENGDTLTAVRGFLKQLLEEAIVDALLVPMETPAGGGQTAVIPALVSEADMLDSANPLAPVMGVNAARVAGQVSIREPRGRVGVVLRSCEVRALVELVKLHQASLDDLVIVGIDCLGTYDVPVYGAMQADGVDMDALLATARTGDLAPQAGYAFRSACQMCEKPHAEGAAIALELFGADVAVGIPVTLPDELGKELGLASDGDEGLRAGVVEKVVAARTLVRDARFAEIREQLDEEGIDVAFATCVRCHNCMDVCPICYCKQCLFRSHVFQHEPVQYLNWARRKGAQRLPSDTMLFHVTRLNHMVLSCIGCGMCSSACPAELPVDLVFRATGARVQEGFDYVPGRDVDEPLPLITFREDEWMEVGEE
jgi:formate dehydrogenase subunit beta